MITKINKEKYESLLSTIKDKDEREEFNEIAYPFFSHPEFQKRMSNDFLHHSDITLGEHIIEDALITYGLCKKKENVNTLVAVKIAMMHDLYEIPWQNNQEGIVKHFSNKHGFRHPIEAAINAITWYPEVFNENDSEILIDGIIHHMYPLPVRVFNNKDMELKNSDKLEKIDKRFIDMIIKSSNRHKVGHLSFSKCLYQEGRIMSKADKKVSFGQIKNFSSAKALLTGKNKSIK